MTTKRLHGKFDAILILVTVLAIGSFVGASLSVFLPQSTFQPSLLFALGLWVLAAFAASVLLAVFGVAKLWLLMGNTDLSKRLCLASLVDFIPCAYMLIGFVYAELRLGYDHPKSGGGFGTRLIVGVFTQRLLVVMVFAAIGCVIQFFSRWRVTGPIGERTIRRNSQTSISDIMVITAYVAGLFGCLTYWMQDKEVWGRRLSGNMEELVGYLSMIAVAEVAFVLLLLAFPLFVSHGAPWVRRHFPRSVALWTCFCGIIVAVFSFPFALIESPDATNVCIGVFMAFAVLSTGLSLVLWLLIRADFRLAGRPNTSSEENWDGNAPSPVSQQRRRVSWKAVGFCLAMVFATAGFYGYYDIPVLLETGSFSNAKLAAAMTRGERVLPEGKQWMLPDGSTDSAYVLSWGPQQISYRADTKTFHFVGGEKELVRLVRGQVPRATRVGLSLKTDETLSLALFTELSVRKFSNLLLDSTEIDPAAFNDYCAMADVENLVMEASSLDNLQSLGHIKTLKKVTLNSTIHWTVEHANAVSGLPFDRLRVKLVDGQPNGLGSLKRLQELEIHSSRIDASTIGELSQLKLSTLIFDNCQIDTGTAKRFSELDAAKIQWSDGGQNDASNEALLAMSNSAQTKVFHIYTEREEKMEVWLLNRSNATARMEFLVDCSGVPGGSGETEFEMRDASDLGELATEVIQNDNGDITEIDLQETALKRESFDELEKLTHLERLRLGHATQSTAWFQRLAKLDSLRELEITGYRLGGRSLRFVLQMEKLRRLQLPICIDADSLRHPEKNPLPQRSTQDFAYDTISYILDEMRQSESFDHEVGNSYGASAYGTDGEYLSQHKSTSFEFQAISNLKDLEYLFMPGHLLTSETLAEIQKLNNLRELHAVLSVVDGRLLEEIIELENLEALSIGTLTLGPEYIATLSRHKKLRTLQVVLFSQKVLSSRKLQQTLLLNLKKGLPNCKVNLLFAGDLSL